MSQLQTLEELLTTISGEGNVGTQNGRLRVASAFGYIDARFMIYMKETHGLPLCLFATEAVKQGLKIDYQGLRYELEKIGKKVDTIESELKEVRFFCNNNSKSKDKQ